MGIKKEGDLVTQKVNIKSNSSYIEKTGLKNYNKIKTLIIRKDMGWCNDYRSKQYNFIYLPSKYRYEKLYRNDNAYDIILVLNYNMNPIKKKKGSAIFLHVAKKNYKKLRCVAIGKRLINILRKIKKILKLRSQTEDICFQLLQRLLQILSPLNNPQTYPYWVL